MTAMVQDHQENFHTLILRQSIRSYASAHQSSLLIFEGQLEFLCDQSDQTSYTNRPRLVLLLGQEFKGQGYTQAGKLQYSHYFFGFLN